MSYIQAGILQTDCAAVFVPLLEPSRYKGAWGGRGSGKSQFFGDDVLKSHLSQPGRNTVCIREVQKSLRDSAKKLLENKIEQYGLEQYGFRATKERIETPGGGQIIFQGMQDHTAESIKSLEGFDCAWVEEAQTLSELSLRLLRPTIRKPGSELWFSWNPRKANDPVDMLLRGEGKPTGTTVVRANWSDNPWFPKELEQERLDDLASNPDQYDHIWEGAYARVFKGAYYASHLEAAQREGRIGTFPPDPILRKYAYWDIGGSSNTSDATAIWIVQFKGEEIRVIDYYEAVGQEFGEHVGWLYANGYERAVMKLPHDGRKHDTVFRVTPRSFLEDAGFQVEVCDNLGAGAAMKRIESARRVFPRCKFDETPTAAGRERLAWYHEKWDEKTNRGLGPQHDDASHGSDAFGQMAVDVLQREPQGADVWSQPLKRNVGGVV